MVCAVVEALVHPARQCVRTGLYIALRYDCICRVAHVQPSFAECANDGVERCAGLELYLVARIFWIASAGRCFVGYCHPAHHDRDFYLLFVAGGCDLFFVIWALRRMGTFCCPAKRRDLAFEPLT